MGRTSNPLTPIINNTVVVCVGVSGGGGYSFVLPLKLWCVMVSPPPTSSPVRALFVSGTTEAPTASSADDAAPGRRAAASASGRMPRQCDSPTLGAVFVVPLFQFLAGSP